VDANGGKGVNSTSDPSGGSKPTDRKEEETLELPRPDSSRLGSPRRRDSFVGSIM
jgi:hypothetical protein